MTATPPTPTSPPAVLSSQRIRVFIDYWNLQITLNSKESVLTGVDDVRFRINWRDFPALVASKAAAVTGTIDYSYEGALIYASYSPVGDASFRNWLNTWLDRQPGIQVIALERQAKSLPRCRKCNHVLLDCPNCHAGMSGTVEKGVDTALATDMIRLAWEDAYDIGVVVSSDSDLVPAAQFLDTKGIKIVQAGFPPSGVHLGTACWASFDLLGLRNEFRRP